MAHIFVVDDSKVQAKAISRILESRSYDITCLESGETCVKQARIDLPDLILMDVVMPGMNGFQATRELTRNASTGHIPIILLSGKDQETDRAWGLRQGARGYLVKPVDDKVLISAVEEALASSQ